jgi:thymidine kinase
MIGTCESCGRDDEDIVRVRRLYVTPEAWDTPGQVVKGDEEHWCFVCRTHYPHEELEET